MNKGITYWAHRGSQARKKANTLYSLTKIYKLGFRHVEFDIWYLKGALILKHNKPILSRIKKIALFSDYVAKYKNRLYYWMDFKNLTKDNAEKVLKLVKKELVKNQIPYSHVNFAPYETDINKSLYLFKTATKIMKGVKPTFVIDKDSAKLYDLEKLREQLRKNNIKCLSVQSVVINEKFHKIFKDTNIYAWVVNKKSEVQRLRNFGITNICTDFLNHSFS